MDIEKVIEISGDEVTLKKVETEIVNKAEYLAQLENELIEHDEGFTAYESASKEVRKQLVKNIKKLKGEI